VGTSIIGWGSDKLGIFIRDIQGRLPELDYEGKQLALDMLGITVWVYG